VACALHVSPVCRCARAATRASQAALGRRGSAVAGPDAVLRGAYGSPASIRPILERALCPSSRQRHLRQRHLLLLSHSGILRMNTPCIPKTHMTESGFRIRVDNQLRREFIRACRSRDLTAAQVLRAFMRDFVRRTRDSAQVDLLEFIESSTNDYEEN
jgi:hypothetical protein